MFALTALLLVNALSLALIAIAFYLTAPNIGDAGQQKTGERISAVFASLAFFNLMAGFAFNVWPEVLR